MEEIPETFMFNSTSMQKMLAHKIIVQQTHNEALQHTSIQEFYANGYFI
jgi:hypothetical protein